jgi:hypothetical protein
MQSFLPLSGPNSPDLPALMKNNLCLLVRAVTPHLAAKVFRRAGSCFFTTENTEGTEESGKLNHRDTEAPKDRSTVFPSEGFL